MRVVMARSRYVTCGFGISPWPVLTIVQVALYLLRIENVFEHYVGRATKTTSQLFSVESDSALLSCRLPSCVSIRCIIIAHDFISVLTPIR